MVALMAASLSQLASNQLTIPKWLEIHGNQYSQAEEFHLLRTAAGFAAGLAFVFVVVWYALMYFCAYVVVILAQILVCVGLLVVGVLCLAFLQRHAQVAGDILKTFDDPHAHTSLNGHGSHATPPIDLDEGVVSLFTVGAVVSFTAATVLALWMCCIRSKLYFTGAVVESVALVVFKLPELLLWQFASTAVSFAYFLMWLLTFLEVNNLVERMGEPQWYSTHLTTHDAQCLSAVHAPESRAGCYVARGAGDTTCSLMSGWSFRFSGASSSSSTSPSSPLLELSPAGTCTISLPPAPPPHAATAH
jgi:hypothetical protein